MILAILVAYKAFNDKSLTIVTNDGTNEYCFNNINIDNISASGIVSFKYFDNNAEQYLIKHVWLENIIGIQFQN